MFPEVSERKRVTTSKFRIRERGTEIGRAIKAATIVATAAIALIKTRGSKPVWDLGPEALDLPVREENSTEEFISKQFLNNSWTVVMEDELVAIL